MVEIRDCFPASEKFVKSAVKLKRTVGIDELNEKKRFWLRKTLTKLRKRKARLQTNRKTCTGCCCRFSFF